MALGFFKRLANKILNRPKLPSVQGAAPTADPERRGVRQAVAEAIDPNDVLGRLFRKITGKRRPEPEPAAEAPPEVPAELTDSWLLDGSWMDVIGSSNVEKIKYDWDDQDLWVGFLSGSIYVYNDVPPEVALEMSKTKSKGRFVWDFLRDVYSYHRMTTGNRPTPRMVPRNKNVVRIRRDQMPANERKEFQLPGVKHLVSKWKSRI